MRLSPYHESWYLAELAYAYRSTGQTDNALEAWRAFLARSTDSTPSAHGHIHIALILESLGKAREARAEVARALEFDPSISISGLEKQRLDRDRAHASVETQRSLGVPE